MIIKRTFYIQAEKYTFQDEFTISVNTFRCESDERTVVIDIEEVEREFDIPDFTQEQFTNGHVEQLRNIREKLKADTQMKIKSLNEQIESLLALECK